MVSGVQGCPQSLWVQDRPSPNPSVTKLRNGEGLTGEEGLGDRDQAATELPLLLCKQRRFGWPCSPPPGSLKVTSLLGPLFGQRLLFLAPGEV